MDRALRVFTGGWVNSPAIALFTGGYYPATNGFDDSAVVHGLVFGPQATGIVAAASATGGIDAPAGFGVTTGPQSGGTVKGPGETWH